MSGLHPEARDLIEAANRVEPPPSREALARIQRSVLSSAVVGGAAAVTGSATMTAHAGVLGAGLTMKVLASGVIGVLAGVAVIAASAARVVSPRPHGSSLSEEAPVRGSANAAPVAPRAEETKVGLVTVSLPSPGGTASSPPPATPGPAGSAIARSFAANEPAVASVKAGGRSDEETRKAAGERVANGAPSILAEPLPAEPAQPQSRTKLAEQLQLLHEIDTSLRAGRAEQALELVGRNETLLRGGPLEEEAHAARISALCQLGRDDDARIAIDHFLAAWSHAPLASRMRGGCRALLGGEVHGR